MIHSNLSLQKTAIPQRLHHFAASEKAVDVSEHPHVDQEDVVDSQALSFLTAWVQEPDTLLAPEEIGTKPEEASTEELAPPEKKAPSVPVRLTTFDHQAMLGD